MNAISTVMATYYIFLAEFEESETGLIDALFTLGDRFLADTWRFGISAKADAILLAYDSTDGATVFHRYQRENPATPIILCGDNLPKAQWCLKKKLGSLPKIHEFTDILNRVGGELDTTKQPDNIQVPVLAEDKPFQEIEELRRVPAEARDNGNVNQEQSETDGSEKHLGNTTEFFPEDYFLGLLQQAQKDGVCRSFIWNEQPALYFIPQQNTYYSPVTLDDLTALFCLPVRQITTKKLDTNNAQNKIAAAGLTAMPEIDLVWCAALSASQGRLLVKCDDEDIVNLKYWPDISHLPRYREFLPLAAFMNNNAGNLPTIAQTTGKEMGVVYDFHNACEALGLLDRNHSQPTIRRRTISTSLRNVCQRISDKLNAH